MIATLLLAGLGAAALAAMAIACWNAIREFLLGRVRDLLVKYFGAEKCEWYSNFLNWCDKKIAVPVRQLVKMHWKKFRDTVLKIKSTYTKNADGTYTKVQETLVRTGPKQGRRVFTEETVGWEYLPDAVRDEMLKRRTNVGKIDDRELVAEKVRQRAEEDGIALTT
jgi:hypothetical protein